MADFSSSDLGSIYGSSQVANKNLNIQKKGSNLDLDMTDFIQLMITQLTNQGIDESVDTSDMLNQMIQMQMISAISNMTETSVQSYASSLVGKVVTIGIVTDKGLEEREVIVTGTGVMNGQQVIFGKDASGKIETYGLNQIMAVGQLPPPEETPDEGDGDGEETPPVDGEGNGETPPAGGDGNGETPPVEGGGETPPAGGEGGDTQGG